MSVLERLKVLPRTPAGWLVRLRRAPVTPQLDAEFRRWLAASEANEMAYERQELAWELAGELADDPEIAAMIAQAQGGEPVDRSLARARRLPRAWAWTAVAACLVAVVLGGYFAALYRGQVHTTSVGEQRTVVLPDQSHMSLNTNTRVRVVYARGSRTVHLERGEATFAVVRDPSRPFEVQAAQGTARALGTEFNVLALSVGVTVSVLSGRVEVLAASDRSADVSTGRAVLAEGEAVTYSGDLLTGVQAAELARIRAWHAGRVAFEDVALSDALAEFNRYSAVPIGLGDRSLSGMRVSGVFRVGETEALLRALEHAFGLRVQRGDAGILLWPAEPQLD